MEHDWKKATLKPAVVAQEASSRLPRSRDHLFFALNVKG